MVERKFQREVVKDEDDLVRKRRCYSCEREMIGKRQNYRYTECGLESVVLKNIVVYHCECGSIVPEIPSIDQLHAYIALDLLRKTSLLAAQEIKFLRTAIGYSGTKLANVMGINGAVISRWENGKSPIGKESDRLLRFACFFAILNEAEVVKGEELQQAFDVIKELKSINLPEIFQRIEDKHSGLKPVCLPFATGTPIASDLVQ